MRNTICHQPQRQDLLPSKLRQAALGSTPTQAAGIACGCQLRVCPVCESTFRTKKVSHLYCSINCRDWMKVQRKLERKTGKRNQFNRKPDPTPQQIIQRAEEIRRGWSPAELAQRTVQPVLPFEIPRVRVGA